MSQEKVGSMLITEGSNNRFERSREVVSSVSQGGDR